MEIDTIFYELKKPDDNTHDTRFSWGADRLLPIKLLEKSIEDEVTLEYYINLMEPFYVPLPSGELFPSMMKDDIELRKDHPDLVIDSLSPTAKFRLLLESDYEISQVIMEFKKDLFNYFEHLQKKVRTLFESVLLSEI